MSDKEWKQGVARLISIQHGDLTQILEAVRRIEHKVNLLVERKPGK